MQQYASFPLKDDIRGAAMVGIADLDGDGVYDFVVKHPGGGKDPGRAGPNRGSYKYDGYSGKAGQFLWRIDLGWNVDMGIWWTPMVVRDLDGDNRAEVCVRTSTYAATQDEMLPSGKTGFLLDAPEYLAVYDGATGQEIDRVAWIELGKVRDRGDNPGNRASRHMPAVAYLDGKTPADQASAFPSFEFWPFEFVSDFELRDSNLSQVCTAHPTFCPRMSRCSGPSSGRRPCHPGLLSPPLP